MLSINELSVGDYILFNGSPYIVEEISAKGWIHILDPDTKAKVSMSSDYILGFIEGVPLTSEILEKNGFEWDSYHNKLIIVCGSAHICWGFYKNCLSISDWSNDGDNQISSIRCVYVHELQHILHHCGIDKEIIIKEE